MLTGKLARRGCDPGGEHEPEQRKHQPKRGASFHATQASRFRVKTR
jgi:hypothetical protein